ncbi:MAG: polymer-forming cytoskeletal protein [Alphaproteobacteria bacterium]|nr:polymer-forming cytoskeletal protein [Alphaproteobacteria bacterium]
MKTGTKYNNPGVLVVGDGISFRGETIICENLIVSGKLEASASCSRLKISDTGTVFGNVTASNAEIRGVFEGFLLVKGCLIIHPGARVFGRVTYAGLRIFRGGKLLGDIRHASDLGANAGMERLSTATSSLDLINKSPACWVT